MRCFVRKKKLMFFFPPEKPQMSPGRWCPDVSDKERRASSNLWGAAMKERRAWTTATATATATTATPITAPPSPLPSLRRLSRRCAVIAIAVPPPSLPSLRPIAVPPLLRCHHNRCAATASAVVARPHTGLPSACQRCICLTSVRR